MGDELYWVDENGNKRDAELHDDPVYPDEMLEDNAREYAKKLGWSLEEAFEAFIPEEARKRIETKLATQKNKKHGSGRSQRKSS